MSEFLSLYFKKNVLLFPLLPVEDTKIDHWLLQAKNI